MSKSIAVVSGGLDSTTMIYHLREEGHELHLLSFDYGQRHKKELKFASIIARNLGLRHDIIDLTGITHLISNSALTSHGQRDVIVPGMYGLDRKDIDVPEGHYAEDTMKLTVVPNRNMIMLSIAAGIAINEKADYVVTAVHAGDHDIYPDCRPAFIEAANRAAVIGSEGLGIFSDFTRFFNARSNMHPFIDAPFIHWTKTDIAFRAFELNVPLHMTWSCYKGNEKHCGRCGTCVERLEAISAAQDMIRAQGFAIGGTEYMDQTEYEDNEYWKTVMVHEARSRHA
jgi:7-cyano-7-deazaguanine synthase